MGFGFVGLFLVGFFEGGVILFGCCVLVGWVVFFKLGKEHISEDRGVDNMPSVTLSDLCILSCQKKD